MGGLSRNQHNEHLLSCARANSGASLGARNTGVETPNKIATPYTPKVGRVGRKLWKLATRLHPVWPRVANSFLEPKWPQGMGHITRSKICDKEQASCTYTTNLLNATYRCSNGKISTRLELPPTAAFALVSRPPLHIRRRRCGNPTAIYSAKPD
jgi:hypothetical protein